MLGSNFPLTTETTIMTHQPDTDCVPDTYGVLVQSVAQLIVDEKVTGSSPVHPATRGPAAS